MGEQRARPLQAAYRGVTQHGLHAQGFFLQQGRDVGCRGRLKVMRRISGLTS